MITIKLIKGDYVPFNLELKDSQNNPFVIGENQDIIFTIQDKTNKKAIIQKRYINGDIVFDEDVYKFKIDYSDTIEMQVGKYVGDLKFVDDLDSEVKPQTIDFIELEIVDEVTNQTTDFMGV